VFEVVQDTGWEYGVSATLAYNNAIVCNVREMFVEYVVHFVTLVFVFCTAFFVFRRNG